MIRVMFYLRLIDLNKDKVSDTFGEKRQVFPEKCSRKGAQCTFSLNSLKNLPISDTRFGVPTETLTLKGLMARLENQKKEQNA